MACIYEIYNDINGKVYIGKTEGSIKKRFKEHCREASKTRSANRPLYRAMCKYGIEHFHIRLLEETDIPEEREAYWIAKKQSYHFGYNATHGGDGKKYIDYGLVVSAYAKLKSVKLVAEELGICEQSVSKILHSNNIKVLSTPEKAPEIFGKSINQFTKDGDFIQTFSFSVEAARSLGKLRSYEVTPIWELRVT